MKSKFANMVDLVKSLFLFSLELDLLVLKIHTRPDKQENYRVPTSHYPNPITVYGIFSLLCSSGVFPPFLPHLLIAQREREEPRENGFRLENGRRDSAGNGQERSDPPPPQRPSVHSLRYRHPGFFFFLFLLFLLT